METLVEYFIKLVITVFCVAMFSLPFTIAWFPTYVSVVVTVMAYVVLTLVLAVVTVYVWRM